MNSKKYRELTTEKLIEKMTAEKSALHTAQFDVKIGQEKDFSIIKKKKKEIARMQTILNEKQQSNGNS